ncbi:MAG: hypothetical protein JEZ11_17935 [Desulfobacterales bacterium]|nr:hypothetical protein [Desulfobacterales bacterium]
MALSLDRIRENQRVAKEEASRRAANFFQFKSGRNPIRILAPWEGSDDISRPMGKHWNLGTDGKTSVFCPKQCEGLPCPICEEIDRRWKAKPSEEEKTHLRSIGASKRYYINMLDLNDMEKGVQIGELPKTVLEEIWNIMLDTEAGVGDITDWDNGYDLIVEKTGVSLSTRYTVRAKRAPSSVPREYEASLVNLETFVKTETYSDLKMIWEGKTPVAVAAAPAAPAISYDPDVVEGVVVSDVSEKITAGLPACFGGFNEELPQCLDCSDQDECESKMQAERRKATPAAVAPKAAPAPAATGATLDTAALMAEMESAIRA